MSQVPPGPIYSDPAGYPPMPGAYPPQPPPPQTSSLWKWIVGIVGVMIFMPCLCCSGCLAYSFTVKDLTISNGEHLGGSPMNIKIDYAFRDDGSRGPLKAYYIVVQAANGTRRERLITGQLTFGFGGTPTIPMSGTWHFGNAVDLGPENNKRYVKVWIESESGGGRSTASNTLTIYPKS
jgi:hypothetical protein